MTDELLDDEERAMVARFKKPTLNDPLRVILDCGNSDVKFMIHMGFGGEHSFPHSVRQVPSSEYDAIIQRYTYRPGDFDGTSIFSVGGVGYVVGRQAAQNGSGQRLTGVNKYNRDHMGAMLKAALIQLYPGGHPNVELVVLHPVDVDSDGMLLLNKAVAGKHRMKLVGGNEVTYTVTSVIPIEEPVAGLTDFMLSCEGKPYQRPRFSVEPGMRILNVDVGGGLTNFVDSRISHSGKIEPNLTEVGGVVKVGIQNVQLSLAKILKSAKDGKAFKFPGLSTLQDIPLSMLNQAIMTNTITIKGQTYDCTIEVEMAMRVLVGPIEQVYKTVFDSGISDDLIVVSGGGGGGAFAFLNQHVFNHPNVYSSERRLERNHLSNIHGASKGLAAFLAGMKRRNNGR